MPTPRSFHHTHHRRRWHEGFQRASDLAESSLVGRQGQIDKKKKKKDEVRHMCARLASLRTSHIF